MGQGDEFERTIQRRLEAEVARLQARVVALRAGLEPLAPDCALGRQGRVETQAWQAVRARELEAAQQALRDNQAALARLDAGQYGRCEHCGSPVARARLLVQPQSRRCSECAQ